MNGWARWTVAVAVSVFLGCASSTHLRFARAPELTLTGVKSLRLEPFAFTADVDLGGDLGRHGLEGAVVGLFVDEALNARARRKEPEFQALLRSAWTEALTQNAYYSVSEGGADARVTGTLHYNVRDARGRVKEKQKDGGTVVHFEAARVAEATVRFTVTDRRGDVLGASTFSTVAQRKGRAARPEKAEADLPAWDVLVREAIGRTAPLFLEKIAPHDVWVRRVFASGRDPALKDGILAAKRGDWGAARVFWEKAEHDGLLDDAHAALYNLAICDEAEDKLDDALARYTRLHAATGKNRYLADLERVRQRRSEVKRLRQLDDARTGSR